MNTELLLSIKEQILKEPENFIMGDWHCGTAHCIGGWVQYLLNKERKINDLLDFSSCLRTPLGLDLNCEQEEELCYIAGWPEDLSDRYSLAERAGDKNLRAQIAAERIDRFIEQYKEELPLSV